MPKSRVRKNRGKGKGSKAKRKARHELNARIRAGVDELSPERRFMQIKGMVDAARGA